MPCHVGSTCDDGQECTINDRIFYDQTLDDCGCAGELISVFGEENTTELCSDGIDNDCDGLIDCLDDDCAAVLGDASVVIEHVADCSDYYSGSIELEFSQHEQFSIDNGNTFQNARLFSNLSPNFYSCLLYTSPSPRDATLSRMPSSA